MTDKACELLELAVKALEFDVSAKRTDEIKKEIRAYLAESEVKREVLSIEEAHSYYSESHYDKTGWVFFLRGIRFAEKHHGIGGE